MGDDLGDEWWQHEYKSGIWVNPVHLTSLVVLEVLVYSKETQR